jgi:hypothetical protein
MFVAWNQKAEGWQQQAKSAPSSYRPIASQQANWWHIGNKMVADEGSALIPSGDSGKPGDSEVALVPPDEVGQIQKN